MNTTNDDKLVGVDNILNVAGSCFIHVNEFPYGLWDVIPSGLSIFQHPFIRLQVQLILMVFITNFFHFFFKRIYLPRFTSEILTGILLGPTFFEKEFSNESRKLFPPTPDIVMSSLAKIGFTLFVFAAAVRMDLSLISRIGRKPWILGIVLFTIPHVMMHSLKPQDSDDTVSDAIKNQHKTFFSSNFVSISNSHFVGVTNLLMELKITNSRLGHLALASTMVSALLRCGYSVVLSCMDAFYHVSMRAGLQTLVLYIIFIPVILYPLKYLVVWLIRNTPEDKTMKDIYTTLIIALVVTLAIAGETVGLYYVYGPFLFGLLVPAGSLFAVDILKELETMVIGLLLPLLATFCAMKFDLWLFIEKFHGEDKLFKVALVGFICKLIATYITAIACRLALRDAAALTLIVNAKGVWDVGQIMNFSEIEDRFLEDTSAIFLVFLLATVITPLVKILYDPAKQYIGYKNKSIEQTPDYIELQIVACAYKQEDAKDAIKLLECSNPTKQSPLIVYGLCLEELVGSATPVWIDHQLGEMANANRGSHSQPLIDVFNNFKSQHKKLVQMHIFTAISPLKQMHEDICWLSFEKAVSLVIVPFHKKWNNKGKVVSTNADIREVNINVLERAPCSVGILIDRPKDRGLHHVSLTSSIYRVCVVFIGGPDDREALAYALRMARSDRVQLTVMHFTVPDDFKRHSWEALLDNETLRRTKDTMTKNHMNIEYIEERVKDGSETSTILLQMQEHFDLFMVGHSQDSNPQVVSGLSNWMEFAELGPLGDLFASSDITCPASVLVVQQQIMKVSHSSTLNHGF